MKLSNHQLEQIIIALENCRNVLNQAIDKFGRESTETEDSRDEVLSVISHAEDAIQILTKKGN